MNKDSQLIFEAYQKQPSPARMYRDAMKDTDPVLYAHLIKASHEAYENTGDAAGEYGTLHAISQAPPSKRQALIDKKLIYDTLTSAGPDVNWDRLAPLVGRVKRILGRKRVVDAWKDKSLIKVIKQARGFGPQSDRFREEGDKYY